MGTVEYRHSASCELNPSDGDSDVRELILQPHRLGLGVFFKLIDNFLEQL